MHTRNRQVVVHFPECLTTTREQQNYLLFTTPVIMHNKKIPTKDAVIARRDARNKIALMLENSSEEGIVWFESLPAGIEAELKAAGWTVKTTHKPRTDGPGTRPSYRIS